MPQPTSLFHLASALALSVFIVVEIAAQNEGDWSEFEMPIGSDSKLESYEETEASVTQQQLVPFRRRIMREDITVRIKTLRLDSGKRVRLVYGTPKQAKKVPAVFVMDVETNALATGSAFNLPRASKRQRQEFREASYLLTSPFGSNMLGSGFAVAYVVADDLETLRSARTPDWIGIFDRVRDLKSIDSNNVFLFSTREYANLSVFLTSKYNFSGLILEEPNYMLFSSKTHEEIIGKSRDLSADEIWQRTDPTREFVYETVLNRISTPIMLIRNPESSAYSFNQKTLIPKLDLSRAYYQTVEVSGKGRDLTVFGGDPDSGVIEVSPRISYDTTTVSKWVSEIITYMRMNSTVDPIALRDPLEAKRW